MTFFVTALIMPFIINVNNLNIYESLYNSIEYNDQGLLIITSFKLVLMNAIRILPVYISSFTMVMFIKDATKHEGFSLLMSIGLLMVPLLYLFIDKVLGIHYDFGLTSVMMMITIFILVRNDFIKITLVKKSVFIILLIIGLQWVDIVPALTDYGFGQGEVSFDVKQATRFMNAEEAVTLSAVLFVLIFLTNAFMVLKLLKDQNTVIETMESKNKIEIELREVKLQSLRARSLEEMQNLVHDLKSPLTSIQGLVSLSEMMVEDDKVKEYMHKISGSVDQLNVMISEILHEKNKHKTCIEDLMRSVLSHLTSTVSDNIITVDNRLGRSSVEINKIRFTRMIINLINNSINALDDKGRVKILIYDHEDKLYFEIIDNGSGIERELLLKIREPGFSTKGSSGIGLRYVADVIKNHQGTFRIESKVDVGTQVIIELDKGKVNYEEHTCNRRQ